MSKTVDYIFDNYTEADRDRLAKVPAIIHLFAREDNMTDRQIADIVDKVAIFNDIKKSS